jgi:hypothetical protein
MQLKLTTGPTHNIMNKETVTISKKEYESLLEDRKWLQALENAGVDNWEGYDYARELMNEDE